LDFVTVHLLNVSTFRRKVVHPAPECQLFWVDAEVIGNKYRPLYKKKIEALPRYTPPKRRNIWPLNRA